MSSARPSSSAVLHVLGRLSLLLPLLLWPVPAAVRGDCGLPPDLPNATPDLRGVSTFAPGDTVTYKCDTNFVKIPGLSDTATCQDTYQWSEMQPFCNRSCNDPPHLIYASLKRPYRDQNYFPVGSTVEYECRLGYKRDQGRPTITCLESLEWSQPEQFCTKKRCPHPGELTNGDIKIETDILFGSTIYFSCDLGYQLIGEKSSFCLASENGVNWSNKLPICREVQCPDPPPIENGRIREESATYSYRQVVSYQCDKGFVMVGNGNTFCNEEGAWSTPLPECRGKNAPPKATVSTTENVPSTPRPTQSNGPSIEVPPTTRKPSSTSTSGASKIILATFITTSKTNSILRTSDNVKFFNLASVFGEYASALFIHALNVFEGLPCFFANSLLLIELLRCIREPGMCRLLHARPWPCQDNCSMESLRVTDGSSKERQD
ncbi:complement decay-accelerating factor isoform X4 [Ochotona curzoniae]|uniref:complement decay-accelerating factor isoform X4 n=1 Tax=Ochotona curzoniae TaxID=130825 RepID=UPI001B34994C|nr:complement decay-accelerating factor isoform X4 [Ochotona curzoniae]